MTGEPEPECRRACLRCGGLIPLWRERKSVFSPLLRWAECFCRRLVEVPAAAAAQPGANPVPHALTALCASQEERSSDHQRWLRATWAWPTSMRFFPLETRFLETQGCLDRVLLWLMSVWTKSRGRLCFFDNLLVYVHIKLYVFTMLNII